jgi:hypothetical protein
MKILKLRSLTVFGLALVGGLGLGYFVDDLNQRIHFVNPIGPVLYVGAILGWVVVIARYWLALRFQALARFGLRPTRDGLLFLLTWWLATLAGGVAFFLINGTDYMTLPQIIVYSAWSATAFNFVLVALPLLVLTAVRPEGRHPARAIPEASR